MTTAAGILNGYEMISIDCLCTVLKRDSRPENIEFRHYQRDTPVKNPFISHTARTEPSDRRTVEIYAVEEGQNLLSSLSRMNGESERLITMVHAEKGIITKPEGFYRDYEFIKAEFPGTSFPSGQKIPKSTVKIHAESDRCGKKSVRRRDHLRTLGLFWRRTPLASTLPFVLFLAYPEMINYVDWEYS